MSRWYPIGATTHHALTSSVVCTGPRAVVADRLVPDVFVGVKTVLEKLGAVYRVGTSAFDFPTDVDAGSQVAGALAAGRVMAAANSDGWVPTPTELAEDVASRAHIEAVPGRGRRLEVLEPSAGDGQLVNAVLRGALRDDDRVSRCAAIGEWMHVTAVEVDPRRASQIPTSTAVDVVVGRFEDYATAQLAAGRRFDRVVANVPFAIPGRPALWAEHLLLAWQLLTPGGRLVAIVSGKVLDPGASRLALEAAALVAEHGEVEALDPGVFAESGIRFQTAMVRLDRPLVDVPAVEPGLPGVCRVYSGAEVPVPVDRPLLFRSATVASPVQVWWDGWRGESRVLRFYGWCAACGELTWGFDDGGNDPRGALGNNTVHLIEPDGGPGEPVALCAMCDSNSAASDRGREVAERLWAAVVAPVSAPPVVVPVVAPGPLVEQIPVQRRGRMVSAGQQLSLF